MSAILLGDDVGKNPVNRVSDLLLRPRVLGAIIVFSSDVGVAAVIMPDVDPFLAKVGVGIEKMRFHRASDIARLKTLHIAIVAKPSNSLGDACQ